MLNKVILICSELWRLKRRHFSEFKDGSEEILIDKIAELIVKQAIKEASQEYLSTYPKDLFTYKRTHLSNNILNKIETVRSLNNDVNYKHVLNVVLEKFFIDNPDLNKIKIPLFKHKYHADTES
jgi:hypothetical protein